MTEIVFKEVLYNMIAPIKFIELAEIDLPDIQQPFVWSRRPRQ